MKYLLTSGGVSNQSISDKLLDLLGKPFVECDALCVPTAEWGHPWCTPQSAWRFVSGNSPAPMTDLGWKSVGLLELMSLPHIPRSRWIDWVRAADVLLVDGGDAHFLAYALRHSGLPELFDELSDCVWVGVSAGSMVMTPAIGAEFVNELEVHGATETLGVVDFSIFPHLEHPDMPGNSMADAERWHEGLGGRAFALDDQSAIAVVNGVAEVVSEGQWRQWG